MRELFTPHRSLRHFLGAGLILALLAIPAGIASAGEQYTDRQGRALNGYDPVTYFTDGTAQMGVESITAEYNGASWWFVSEADRELFLADPGHYAPAYDGHCAWALADGRKVRSDPQAWRIVNGRLYLNFNADIQARWERDIPGNLERSEANWPALEADPAARPSRWF